MKTFILDTNVLLHDPEALKSFQEHDLILPIAVIEELDSFKKEEGQLGFNARQVIRSIDELRAKGPLSDGVMMAEDLGHLMVWTKESRHSFSHLSAINDNFILSTVKQAQEDGKYGQVILVSQDAALRIKADAVGLEAQDYTTRRVDAVDAIGRVRKVTVNVESVNKIHMRRASGLALDEIVELEDQNPFIEAPRENEPYQLVSHCGSKSALAKFSKGSFRKIQDNLELCGIKPRNAEQRFLVDALMSESVDLVVCAGAAGAGKTLCSLAAGLEHVEQRLVDRVLITKAIQAVGQDIGFLPGTKEEKMEEWLKPFWDQLELLMRGRSGDVQKLLDKGLIEADALTYMRGRSLMGRFVIVDECQNLHPSVLRTLVSRIADGSKLVLLGDYSQVDNPYLDRSSNGLAYVMARMRDLDNVAVLNMTKSERSRLAQAAIERL